MPPVVALSAIAGLSSCAPVEEAVPSGEWRYFGADKAFTRYSPLDQINRDNVTELEIVWRQPAIDPEFEAAYSNLRPRGNLRSTPLMIDGVLYAPNAVGLVRAMDPGTGETLWEQAPYAPTKEEAQGRSPRGIAYWQDGSAERLFSARGEYLYSIDAATGELDASFGDQGRVSLHFYDELAGSFSWSAGPITVGDAVVVAGITGGAGDGGKQKEAFPEDVRAYDARTGRRLWTFHVVPKPGEFGHESWGEDSWKYSGDLGSWCCVTADEELGLAYVQLTAPTSAYYGGHRPGDNLFSNTLVAIDMKTGERAWHFQMVHHDVWEYDTVGPATLGEITVDGRTIKAVMQPSKTGFLYVFDRETGEPVWPIEERPVQPSPISSESLSPTQPFPTKPAPFDLQGISEDDLMDFTPELRARALEAVEPYILGPMFAPPSMLDDENGKMGTLTTPGWWGAGNWHTGAFDPETGVYYAVSHTQPTVYALSQLDEDDEEATMDYTVVGDPEVPTVDGLPIFKPPYGRITAIDLNTGDHLWMKANGDGPRDHPLLKDLDLPPLGIPSRAAPLLTSTLLFIGEGSNAIMGHTEEMWGKKFRAYDKSTGEIVWETELPSGTTGAPITYLHEGRQFILVAVGERRYPVEWVALALGSSSSP